MSDIIQVADLEKTKFHNTFHVEAVTGKVGGLAGGADIDFTTNAVTGQVQATLPKLLSQIGFAPVDFDFITGGTLTNRSQSIFYEADGNWYSWGGVMPKTIPPASSPVSTGGIAVNAWNISTSAFMYRDYRGVKDDLYYQAGIIDDGTPNQLGDSQFVDAMFKVFGFEYNTVSEMISDSTLKAEVGNIIVTRSRLNVFDGIMSCWEVKEGLIANDIDILASAVAGKFFQLVITDNIYIRELGGIGDNSPASATKNTAIFNRAYKIQEQKTIIMPPPYITRLAVPEVVWGSGQIYAINDEILIPASSTSNTTGAIINQLDPTKDVFRHGDVNPSGAYISGEAYMHFHYGRGVINGGKRQMVLSNDNIDGNHLAVDLEFHNSGNHGLTVCATSGHLMIKGKFVNCWAIANVKNDQVHFMPGTWLDCNKPSPVDGGQIRLNGGTVSFEKVIGVPNSNANSRWVDAFTNSVIFRECRMGDEGGAAGWPWIYAYGQAPTSTRYSPLMAIIDCYTGGGLEPADASTGLIRLAKGDLPYRVPPIISIRNFNKLGSIAAISSELSDAEFEAAIALEPALSYYELDNIQSERFNDVTATIPNGILSRLLRRKQSAIESSIGVNVNLFNHVATKQSLNNQNSTFEVEFHGTFASNANSKKIEFRFAGQTILSHTKTSGDSFHGKAMVSILNNTVALASISLNTTSSGFLYGAITPAFLNFQNAEYRFEIATDTIATNDVNIFNLVVNRGV